MTEKKSHQMDASGDRHRIMLIDARWTVVMEKLEGCSKKSKNGARYMNTGDPTPFFVFHFPNKKQVLIIAGKEHELPLTLRWGLTCGPNTACGMFVERLGEKLVFSGTLACYRTRMLSLLKLGESKEATNV